MGRSRQRAWACRAVGGGWGRGGAGLASFSTLALAFGSGCGFQIGAGMAATARGEARATTSVSAALNAGRKHRGIVGARLTGRYDNGFAIRAGALRGGYDFVVVPGWLTLEPAIELGAGGPVNRLYSGTGAYGGLAGTARLRPLPNSDRGPAFNILYFTPELVFAPRGGFWMAPEGQGRGFDFEYGGELALRLVFGSDLGGPPQGRPGNDRQAPEGGEGGRP